MARAARAWGVTRADLMIALLMQAIAPIAGDERHRQAAARDRHRIDHQYPPRFRAPVNDIVRPVPELVSLLRIRCPTAITLEELARDIHRETSRVRRRKLYLQTLLALAGVMLLWPRLTPSQRANVDAKNYPGVGGLDAARRRRAVAGGRRAAPALRTTTCVRSRPGRRRR